MNRTEEIIIMLRGLLADQSFVDDEIFYHPKRFEIDFQGTFSINTQETSDLVIDIGPEDLSSAQLLEMLKYAVDNHMNKKGIELSKIVINNIATINIKKPVNNTEYSVSGKVALITGAAGAIGYGICRRMLEEGCLVALTDLVEERLNQMVNEFEKFFPGQIIGIQMDVTDKISVDNAFGKVIRFWGGIDIVIINAGIALVASLTKMELKDFQRLEKVNVEGTLLTISEAARCLIAQNTGGDIVLVSTKNVFAPGANFGAYSATKAASHQLARIASLELATYGIRVNMVSPDGVFSGGSFKSGLWQEVGPDRMKARGLDEKGLEDYYKNRNLLKLKITARHVANAVMFFITHQTPTTGATIPVDGGLPDATPR
jgi:NAD(P)-dependent dehydrogenase (short-subunit alcohol dehydrogenase family)